MHHDEARDRGHGEEVHVACGVVAAEYGGEPLQLHRLPDREPRQHDHDTRKNDAEVEELLHGVVVGEVVVGEPAGQGRPGVGDHLAGADRGQLAAEAAAGNAERDVDEAVHRQHPHGGEMPEQGARQPAAEGDAARECEREQGRGVIDLPARGDHDEHGECVDPVRHAHPARVNDRARRCDRYQRLIVGGFDRHPVPFWPIFCTV